MKMIAVSHRHDNMPSTRSDRTLFECSTSARQYARQMTRRGKIVDLTLVEVSGGISILEHLALNGQQVCTSCLQRGTPCNIQTLMENDEQYRALMS